MARYLLADGLLPFVALVVLFAAAFAGGMFALGRVRAWAWRAVLFVAVVFGWMQVTLYASHLRPAGMGVLAAAWVVALLLWWGASRRWGWRTERPLTY